MRLIFAGTPDAAVPALRQLAADHDVVGVLTRPDAPGKRGRTLHPSPVAEEAGRLCIETRKTATLKDQDVLAWVADKRADAVGVVAYGALVPAAAFTLGTHGWINLHFSLLPAYRGAAPVQRAIADGAEATGVSVFRIDEGLDTGPMYGQMPVALPNRPTAGEALSALADAGASYFSSILRDIEVSGLEPVQQPAAGVSIAQRLKPAEGRIDWTGTAEQVDRHIRAFTPSPGAWSETADGTRVKVRSAHPADHEVDGPPGTIALAGSAALVATGRGTIVLETVAPAGKSAMSGDAWLRGFRGEKLFGGQP